MARERMITRTITEVTAKTMVCNGDTGETSVVDYKLTSVTDTKTALKQLKKLYETDTHIIVKVIALEVNEVLYGMSEIDFIKNAKPMTDYFHKG